MAGVVRIAWGVGEMPAASYGGEFPFKCAKFRANVFAAHSTTRCITDPDHSWYGEHADLNFSIPNDALIDTLDNGYERDDEPINSDESSWPNRATEISLRLKRISPIYTCFSGYCG
jgi:hypothetical protein